MKIRPDWQALERFIDKKKRVIITTHVHPDGDAIGSEIAMAEYCRLRGCEPVILNQDPTPEFFHHADVDREIRCFSADQHAGWIRTADGCVVVDMSDWARLKEIGRLLRQHRIPVACADHHIPTDVLGAVQYNLQEASSAGEVLYRFFKDRKVKMTLTMVNALYMCVLTDTGSFRYSNTTPYALRMAADLVRQGAEFQRIYEMVYENESRARTELKGRMLAELQFECGNRLAYFSVTKALLQETGAQLWETEGFSELPRQIKGVEVSIMFTEADDHHVKVSIRSKGRLPINGLAIKFGGGGHLYAAGATLSLPLEQVKQQILSEARLLFEQNG